MRKKVLIVDDSKFNREMLRDALSDEYETAEAGNGVEALEYIEAHRGELVAVLLDIVMPEMDGVELLKILNEKESHSKKHYGTVSNKNRNQLISSNLWQATK